MTDSIDRPRSAVAPPRKHRWRDRFLVLLAMLLITAAVHGWLTTGSWIAINKPGDFLRVDSEAGSWHLAFVHIPAPPVDKFVESMGDVGQQPDFQRRMDQHQLTLDTYRMIFRNGYVLQCDWSKTRHVSRGQRAYFDDLNGSRNLPPVTNLPNPTAWIAAIPAFSLLAPAILLLIIPAFAEWKHRRRLRWLRYCRTCGYDLTGNTTGVCPECGNPLPPDMQPPAPAT